MNPQGTPDLFYGPKNMNWPMKQIQGFPWAVPSQRDSPRVEKKTQKKILWLYGISLRVRAVLLKAVKVPGIHLEPKNICIYGHHWRLFPSESSSSLYHTCVNRRDRLASILTICSMAPFSIYIVINGAFFHLHRHHVFIIHA